MTQDSESVVVPHVPTEIMWGGLARQIILWMDMHPKTPRALFDHLRRSGHDVPQWLRDEPEMQNLDHVPSKGTRAVLIYRAMLAAAPSTSVREEVDQVRIGAWNAAKKAGATDEVGYAVAKAVAAEFAALVPSTDEGKRP